MAELTALPGGEIIATIFNPPAHGSWAGDVECWTSRDGRFWTKCGKAAPYEPGTNRMNVAAGSAADEALVVLASGWSDRSPAPDSLPAFPHDPMPAGLISTSDTHVLEPWVCRFTDGGRMWTRSAAIEHWPDMAALIPFGNVHLDPEGLTCASFYGWDTQSTRAKGKRLSWFFRSEDDGRTWKPMSIIGNRNRTAPARQCAFDTDLGELGFP